MHEQPTLDIDVHDNLPYDRFVSDYLLPHKPVRIKNAFKQWRALGKWSPTFFKANYGDKRVTVSGRETTLGEYFDRVENASPENPVPYLRELAVRQLAPELGDDLMPFVDYALPNWLRGVYPDRELDAHLNRAAEVELFIGGPGTQLERRAGETDPTHAGLHGTLISGFADLHYDPTACPVMLCQIFGEKEWTVFSPEDTPYLYTTGRHSAIPDFQSPDLERFPLYAKARIARFVQEEGEAVYVPPFWWHTTRMLTTSIAVGSTFANQAHWAGVVEDVTREESNPLKRRALAKLLLADGRLKKLAGPRLGESTHFREPPVRTSIRKLKSALKSAISGR
ncbi:MAG: cupin-like domain-containing protein [Polyangiaceae bacterium]